MESIQKPTKWGNSLGIRINKDTQDKLGINSRKNVKLEIKNGKLIITPLETLPTMENLLEGYSPKNRPNNVDFGLSEGREVW
jgi:antitoxin MazE